MDFTKDFFNLMLDFGGEWSITKIEADHKDHKIYLYIEYVADYCVTPNTHERAVLYDHTEWREWRHLDVLQYSAYVRCRIPRVKCTDGKVRRISLGWADKHDRHTFHFETRVIDLTDINIRTYMEL